MSHARVHEIDLLRFVAALAVVFYHYAFRGAVAGNLSAMSYPALAPLAQYGFLGVHLFFMISGFVILMTASRGGIADFAISRAVRLYPALWVCCTLTFMATLAIGAPRFSASTGQYFANLTLLGGFFNVRPMDGVYWSLFVELRFYALTLATLALGRIHRSQRLLLVWLLASTMLQAMPGSKLAYLLIADYSAFFIGGAACYLIWVDGASRGRLTLLAGAWLLALAQAHREAAALGVRFAMTFAPLAIGTAVTAFFAVLLAIALRRTGWFGRQRWLLAGALTYPLYLLHQNVGYMLFNRYAPVVEQHLLFWGVIVLALTAAYAVHRLIERPLAAQLRRLLTRLADATRQRATVAADRERNCP
ncbi:acyltransferase [Dechloromonas sp. XY25]|uniref:Acyltransferase n=1 Tax=Dechloromonas hankyongensis TaxID=2908002 RepID=A0ABS9JYW6_9RHOO|nr:acyltransferase [Dechloromonas hankyongensis]MCG2576101.1 acyltransferase [Dechloromonas hankyongensis]